MPMIHVVPAETNIQAVAGTAECERSFLPPHRAQLSHLRAAI